AQLVLSHACCIGGTSPNRRNRTTRLKNRSSERTIEFARSDRCDVGIEILLCSSALADESQDNLEGFHDCTKNNCVTGAAHSDLYIGAASATTKRTNRAKRRKLENVGNPFREGLPRFGAPGHRPVKGGAMGTS